MRVIAWIALAVVIGQVGCAATSPSGPPPVEIAVRDSVVGRGRVVRLTNLGETTLHLIRLEVKNDKKQFAGVIAKAIRPHSTVEVGWLQLGFPLESGMSVEVCCKDYPDAVTDRIK